MNIKDMVPCQLPHLKLSCYGCCGRDFKSREDIERDIAINTKEFKKIKTPSTLRLLQFRDRLSTNPDDLTPSGVCSNLVDFGDGCIACPLHNLAKNLVPKGKFTQLHRKDLRINHCDVNYECKTFKFWKGLSDDKKRKFVEWVEKQDLDTYTYSMGNISGNILKDFIHFEKK